MIDVFRQIEERFSQLMKLFKKKEKMENWLNDKKIELTLQWILMHVSESL